mmetsp:Transcript_3553/g.14246  ORF Transcript_3553/g.14246 Transcript_3553/m.14246 type:complete len:227 (-) Transcript_3553:2215-2895(-)
MVWTTRSGRRRATKTMIARAKEKEPRKCRTSSTEPPRRGRLRARSYRASRTHRRPYASRRRWRSGVSRACTPCCSGQPRRGGGGAGARVRARRAGSRPTGLIRRAPGYPRGRTRTAAAHSGTTTRGAGASTRGETRGCTRLRRRDRTSRRLARSGTGIPASITSRQPGTPRDRDRRPTLTGGPTTPRSPAPMPRASAAGSTSTSSSSWSNLRRIPARVSPGWRERR